MPKVTICIPVYNVEKYIERCARSLFEQTLDDLEFIFVDDCTPDRSVKILKSIIEEYQLRFAEKNYTARIERMPTNSGLAAVRRQGYQFASGDYITFCDSDDVMPADAIETLYNLAVESGADIVSGDMEWLFEDGTTKRNNVSLPYGNDAESVYRALLTYKYSHNLCGKIFKNDLLCNHTYMTFDNHTNGEDGFLFYQLVQHTHKVVHNNFVCYQYYQNTHSSTHSFITDESLRHLVEFYDYVADIPYMQPELKNLALIYSTLNVNEFALGQGYKRLKTIQKEVSHYHFLSFQYRMKYMTVRQNLRWYAKLLLNSYRMFF